MSNIIRNVWSFIKKSPKKKIAIALVLMIIASVIVIPNINASADGQVIFSHQHGKDCDINCGYEEGECEYCADGDDWEDHFCNSHDHDEWCCSYRSSKNFNITTTGRYKIEVWGSRGGGSGGDCHMINGADGGDGGYAMGIIDCVAGDVLRIHIGYEGKYEGGSFSTYTDDDEDDTHHGKTGGSSWVQKNGGYIAEGYGGEGGESYCNQDGSDYDEDGDPGSGRYTTSEGAVIVGGNDWHHGKVVITLMSCKIVYHSNAPTGAMVNGTMPDKEIEYNKSCYLDANKYSITGYTFKGWSTSPTGSVVYSDKAYISARTSDLHLYAVWEPHKYNVRVYNNKPQDSTSSITNIK